MDDTDGASIQARTGRLVSSTRSQWQDSYRCFSYVASYWSEHVKGSLEEDLQPLVLRIFNERFHLLYGLQEYNKLGLRNLEYDTWPHEPSPLHLAAYWGLAYTVQVLINPGAEVHAKDERERTPLVCAALNGHGDVAYVLLDSGADINAQDRSAATPLHAAVANDHHDISRPFLLRGAEVDSRDKNGSSPMGLAASNGNLAMMDLLLQNGASAEKLAKRDLSPLEIASCRGHTSAVQWLFLKGAGVNSENSFPLLEAVLGNHPQIVRILLDAGVNVNLVNRLGQTALGEAVQQGSMYIVVRLVAAGASVDMGAITHQSKSPLHIAAFNGDSALVRHLINQGADVRAEGGDIGTALQAAIYSGGLSVVRMVLSRLDPSDINIGKGDFGATPLQLAVLLRDTEILRQVLAQRPDSKKANRNADPNLVNSFRVTPLHQALYIYWEPGIDIIVKAGGNPRLIDLYGRTCLDWALPAKHLFRRLGRVESDIPTSATAQMQILKTFIRNLITALLENSDRKEGHRIDYHYLGHCLLRFRDVDEARTSFEQQITNVFSKHERPITTSYATCVASNSSRAIVMSATLAPTLISAKLT